MIKYYDSLGAKGTSIVKVTAAWLWCKIFIIINNSYNFEKLCNCFIEIWYTANKSNH